MALTFLLDWLQRSARTTLSQRSLKKWNGFSTWSLKIPANYQDHFQWPWDSLDHFGLPTNRGIYVFIIIFNVQQSVSCWSSPSPPRAEGQWPRAHVPLWGAAASHLPTALAPGPAFAALTPGTCAALRGCSLPLAHRSGPGACLCSSRAGADNLGCSSRCSYIQVKICRVNRPVTEHLVSQSSLSHSICLLSTYTLKIKFSALESAAVML